MQLKLNKQEIMDLVAAGIESGNAKVRLPEGLVIYGGHLATGGGHTHLTFDLVTPEEAERMAQEDAEELEDPDAS